MPSNDSSKRNAQEGPNLEGYPDINLHEEEILITVKTYPSPSKTYRELVCTAGVTREGKWIRLYPVSYRYLNSSSWYKKYQWIKAEIQKNRKDFRIDSYRPNPKTIEAISRVLPAGKDNWQQRKDILLSTVRHQSMEEVKRDYDENGVSLAMIKPSAVSKFVVEGDTREWKGSQLAALQQLQLFDKQPLKLEKIPFKFSYEFQCSNNKCNGHKMVIRDWEIFQLYRRLVNDYRYDMDVVLSKIKEKWFDYMWRGDRDSYLIVGSQFPNPTFMVLGVFYPPKTPPSLFDM